MNRLKIDNNGELSIEAKHQFETLKSNLEYYGEDKKVIAITSCRDREGKSLVALQTASELARQGKSVILVMADFRKTMVNGEQTLYGLSDVLRGEIQLEEVMYETDINGMHLLFAGGNAQNRNNRMNEDIFRNTMEYFRQTYDYVIVDMSTVGKNINDPVIYSECDGAVLVVETNKVARKLAKHVISAIESSGCKVFGIVLNSVEYYN